MSNLNEKERELVAIGAAIASNCVPCIVFHVAQAKKVGFSSAEIEEAIALAEQVKEVPAKQVHESAHAQLSGEKKSTNNCCIKKNRCC